MTNESSSLPELDPELLASAATERPSVGLKERVLSGLAERRRDQASPQHTGRSRPSYGVFGLGMLLGAAAAAAVAIGWPSQKVRVAPEPLAAVTPSAAASSVAARPKPVDPCRLAPRASGNLPLIDDFEDGDDAIPARDGRGGLWRWNRDTDKPGTAPALLPVPRPLASPKNRLALHVKGGALRDWGASIELTFESGCYDASRYAGIEFSARGPGRIYVAPREVDVIELAFGGTCEKDCYDAHTKKLDLVPGFRTYAVTWGEFSQRGYDRPALDPARLHDLAFLVHPEDTPYDIYIDDVRFLTRGR